MDRHRDWGARGRVTGDVDFAPWRFTAAVATALALLSACSSGDTATPTFDQVAEFRVSGDEVEPYIGFEEMLESADLTVVGTVGAVRDIRTVGDPGVGAAYLLPFEVDVEAQLAGAAPTPLIVELTLGATTLADAQGSAKQFSRTMSGQEVLLYLREKGGESEQGLYRVVNSAGMWMETADVPVAAPLFDGDAGARPEWSTQVAKADSLEQLTSAVAE